MTASASLREPASSADVCLAELIDELTAKLQAGEPLNLDDCVREHPEHAERLGKLLPALRLLADASRSGDTRLMPGAIEAATPSYLGELGDFRLVREIGRGAMGIVYEAEQISLNRPVALKVLPFAATLDPKQLQRFKNEAQAAAQLHHTHIVPVYYVGCERGVHFYAMQYVEGSNLADVIAELRGQADGARTLPQPSPRSPSPLVERTVDAAAGQPIEPIPPTSDLRETLPVATPATARSIRDAAYFRMVAQLGIQAAEALDHAHQHAIVHRDIKPANLLVESSPLAPPGGAVGGEGPRLWVTDFGLAQIQCDTRLTMTGDLVGTLRYMSPEQALAKRVVVDHRTDVYSLGATLYELLTLEPAFNGRDRQELLRQIAFEEPRPPRRLNKAIPAELETIVDKAMEKNPADRYATAQELAEDLEHFLKDEPIRAKRPTLVQRARKWGRRHEAITWSALIMVFLVLAATAFFFWREKHWTDQAYADLVKEQQKTETALAAEGKRRKQLRNVLDSMTSHMVEELMTKQKQLPLEEKQFLADSLKAYEDFAEDTGQDEEARAGVANAYYRAGEIQYKLGKLNAAETAWEEGRKRYASLAADFPTASSYRRHLGNLHARLAKVFRQRNQTGEAEDAYHLAVAAMKQLVDAFPGVPSCQADLATIQDSQGVFFMDFKRFREAEEPLRQALAIRKKLAEEFLERPDYRNELAASHANLGTLFQLSGRLCDAELQLGEALAIDERLAADFPQRADARFDLAKCQANLGVLFAQTHRFPKAEHAFTRARAIFLRLVVEYPAAPDYRHELAGCLRNLGNSLDQMTRATEVEDFYRQALAVYKLLVADFPDVPVYAHQLAEAHLDLGALIAIGRPQEAEETLRQALVIEQKLIDQSAARSEYRAALASIYESLGRLLVDNRRLDEGVEAFRQSLAVYQRLVAEHPKEPSYGAELAGAWGTLGVLFSKTKQFQEAEAAFHEALVNWERLSVNFPDVADYRLHQAAIHGKLSDLFRITNRNMDAEEQLKKALVIEKQLVADFPGVPDYHNQLAGTMVDLATRLQARWEFQAARQLYEEALPHHQAALKASPRQPDYRRFYRNNRAQLTATLVGLEDHAAVARTAEELIQAAVDLPNDTYTAACFLCACMLLAEENKQLDELKRKALIQSYGDRAMAALRLAVERGFKDIDGLKKDQRLDPLRGRGDFKKLVSDLEVKGSSPIPKEKDKPQAKPPGP